MPALLIGLGSALLAGLAALFLAALVAAPRGMPMAALLRVYPDIVRLMVALARDKRVAASVRWRLLLAVAYNVQPLNLIPDFIPVIGFADNVIVTGWAIRSAVRKSGAEVVASHWRGDSASFVLVCRLCRLPAAQVPRQGEQAEDRAPGDGHAHSEKVLSAAGSDPGCAILRATKPDNPSRCPRHGSDLTASDDLSADVRALPRCR